jgi:hypothetical protein
MLQPDAQNILPDTYKHIPTPVTVLAPFSLSLSLSLSVSLFRTHSQIPPHESSVRFLSLSLPTLTSPLIPPQVFQTVFFYFTHTSTPQTPPPPPIHIPLLLFLPLPLYPFFVALFLSCPSPFTLFLMRLFPTRSHSHSLPQSLSHSIFFLQQLCLQPYHSDHTLPPSLSFF